MRQRYAGCLKDALVRGQQRRQFPERRLCQGSGRGGRLGAGCPAEALRRYRAALTVGLVPWKRDRSVPPCVPSRGGGCSRAPPPGLGSLALGLLPRRTRGSGERGARWSAVGTGASHRAAVEAACLAGTGLLVIRG